MKDIKNHLKITKNYFDLKKIKANYVGKLFIQITTELKNFKITLNNFEKITTIKT